MSNFLIPLSHWVIVQIRAHAHFLSQNLYMCLYSLSMDASHHICYFGFLNENKDFFLLKDNIWKCQIFKQPFHLNLVRYLIQIFRIFTESLYIFT